MRRFSLRDSIDSFETLEVKLSPTTVAVGAFVSAPAVAALHAAQAAGPGDDPLPPPEPPPGPDPGGDPPIGYPVLPPSGPIGPG
jgi:hypothetical protein